jgi:hypothetical protein
MGVEERVPDGTGRRPDGGRLTNLRAAGYFPVT